MMELKEILENIKETHKDFIVDDEFLVDINDIFDKKGYVESLQEICNNLFNQYGFDDTILELQVYINQLRHEFDITDPREVLHIDNGKGYVQ